MAVTIPVEMSASADEQPYVDVVGALKLLVQEVNGSTWVTLDGGGFCEEFVVELIAGRYHCDCQPESGCSHITAVMLSRARRRVKEIPSPSIPAPSDPRFSTPPLPDWVQTFRPQQWDAVEQIQDHFAAGVKTIIMQAPTGSGKSLIGELVRRLVGGDAVYVCSTKTLQDQMYADFPYGERLKGRANYTPQSGPVDGWGRLTSTTRHSGTVVTCADCTSTGSGSPCRFCEQVEACPYRVARSRAQSAPLAILNTAYWLADCNRGRGNFAGRDLAIIDEADLLEGEVLSQVEVRISARTAQRLGIEAPERKTVEAVWPAWIEHAIGQVAERLTTLPPPRDSDVGQLRERRRLKELQDRLKVLSVELPEGGWVYDGYRRGETPRGQICFRPVKVDGHGAQYLWPHADRFLLMSGSVISADEMAGSLGLGGRWELVDVPMTFPAKNRPVRVVGLAEVSAKRKEAAWPEIVKGVAGVLALHPDERVLVHTVSYQLAEHVVSGLRGSGRVVFTYRNALGRDEALARYRGTPGSVLVAPSMDRGVDLPGDMCRVQVICKVPYPNLGDKRTSARLHSAGGQAWYLIQTVRTIMQMTGRAVRSEGDSCCCVAPGTKVLTADLRWLPAEALVAGDAILGFDEAEGTRQEQRRWRRSEVVANGVKSLPRMRIHFTDGTSIISTPDHRWVSKWGQSRDDSWVRTDRLRPGHHLNRYVPVWDEERGRDAGWLAGILDGEGCLSVGIGARNRTVLQVTIAQKPGVVVAEIEHVLSALGFKWRTYDSTTAGVKHVRVQGGLAEQLRLLGSLRPARLLSKFAIADFQPRFRTSEYVEVESVEDIGLGPMVTLQSATETYIADGFGAHNTYILDRKFLQVWRGSQRLFPQWWRDALDFSFPRHRLVPMS